MFLTKFRKPIQLKGARYLFGFNKKLEPIEYKTVQQIAVPALTFYNVVKDVDNYKNFLPWWTHSEVLKDSHKQFTKTEGEFKGRMSIGFSSMSFSYDSVVTYKDFDNIIVLSDGGSVFDELYSKWNVQFVSTNKSVVNYEVKMTFSNPLYSKLTKYFFDSIVVNINDAFVKAWNINYDSKLDEVYEKRVEAEGTVRELLDKGMFDVLDKKLREPRKLKDKITKNLNEKANTSHDYEFKVDPRLDRRRTTTTRLNFGDDSEREKEDSDIRRLNHSKNLIRDLFKDNTLSRLDRDKVNQKMQNKEFLNDIYILDQALGGSPDYKKRIAKHIKDNW